MNPQEYRLNIRPGCGISPTVKVSQGDIGRPLVFNMLDGTDALEITSGTTVTMKGLKPSGLGFTANCSWTGSQVSILTAEAMTQEPGAVAAELIFTLRSSVIGTANFVLYVEPAAHPEGTTDGTIAEAKTVLQQAEAAADRAEEAAEAISQAGIDTTGSTAGQVPTANGAGGWTWEDQQGGGTSDDIENKSSVSGATVTGALNTLSDQIANLEGGAPTAVSTVAQMVDTTQVYLYTGTESGYVKGAWYYWDGSAWVSGGIYGLPAEVYVDGTSLVINTMMTNGNEVAY